MNDECNKLGKDARRGEPSPVLYEACSMVSFLLVGNLFSLFGPQISWRLQRHNTSSSHRNKRLGCTPDGAKPTLSSVVINFDTPEVH